MNGTGLKGVRRRTGRADSLRRQSAWLGALLHGHRQASGVHLLARKVRYVALSARASARHRRKQREAVREMSQGCRVRPGVGIACLGVTFLAACGGSAPASPTPSPSSSPTSTASTSSTASTTACPATPPAASPGQPVQLKVLSSASVPIDGQTLLAGLGAVWAASSKGLVKLSVPDASPTIVVNQPVDDIALSPTWVYALTPNQLLEVAPQTLRVTRRWNLGANPMSIASSAAAVYVLYNQTPPAVDRIDIQTGAVAHSVISRLPDLAKGRAIAFGGGAVWVTSGMILSKLDPTTLSLRGSTPLPLVTDIWFGNGGLWAASDQPDGGVLRIDPASGCVVAQTTSDAIQIAFSPAAVWLSAAAGPTALDPITGVIRATTAPSSVLSGDGAGIAVVGNEVWVCYADIGKLQRLQIIG